MALAGKQAGLYIGNPLAKVAETTDVSLKIDGKTIDTTSFDSNEWDEFINGTKSWSIDGTYNFKPTDTAQLAIMNNIINASQPTMPIEFRFTNAATPPKISGNVITSGIQIDTAVADKITMKGTLQGSGAPTFSAGS
jgi:predicted secreted protein